MGGLDPAKHLPGELGELAGKIQSAARSQAGRVTLPCGLPLLLRWQIRHDMPEVLAIEQASFQFAWTEEDFIRVLRQRNCIGMVAVDSRTEQVLGYMIYELLRTTLGLLNFAVMPEVRRRGVGRAMIEKLVGKLSANRRRRIEVEVRETNLAAQLFFKACEFRAVGVLKGHYENDETHEDAYLFCRRVKLEPVPAPARSEGCDCC